MTDGVREKLWAIEMCGSRFLVKGSREKLWVSEMWGSRILFDLSSRMCGSSRCAAVMSYWSAPGGSTKTDAFKGLASSRVSSALPTFCVHWNRRSPCSPPNGTDVSPKSNSISGAAESGSLESQGEMRKSLRSTAAICQTAFSSYVVGDWLG